MAEPVLLISSDPFLGASLEAIARGRVQVARLDLATRPAAWPAEPTATVVLDVAAGQRDAVHAWIRRHHRGPLVVLLKPGERRPALPPSPAQVVIGRPFRLAELVAILEHPPDPLSSEGLGLSPPDPLSFDPPPAPGPDPDPAPPPPVPGPGRSAAADRDLLQASAAERRRRLDALSGHTAAPGRLPRPDWPTAATVLDVRRPRRGARRRRVVARVLVGLLVLLVLAAGWLALGLLEARQQRPVPAVPAVAGAADLRG